MSFCRLPILPRLRKLAIGPGAFLLSIAPALAWGPHPAITQAALDVLRTNDAIFLQLGESTQRLTNYAWMADYRRLPFEDGAELFYADDYLIFPGVPTHLDHILPEVKQTYRPYFKRTLQALRTESSINAARWVGSLLHFAEDSGSPPHAAQLRGDVHTKMENWIDPERITIPGYRPNSFGMTDDQALEGFVKRMDELVEFSKGRARRLQLPVAIGDRASVKPVVLESALETSRVMADLLLTLGRLSQKGQRGLATLHGVISSVAPPGPLDRFPAKVVLRGTSYSTLADAKGRFEFHNLPPATYQISAFRPGNGLAHSSIVLLGDKTNECAIDLPAKDSNLIRNGDFKLQWARPGQPDCWYSANGAWEGEIIPLKIGQRYRLTAQFKESSRDELMVRWTRYLPHAVPRTAPIPKMETRTLTPQGREIEFTGAESLGLLQVILRAKGQPSASCDAIRLVAVPDK